MTMHMIVNEGIEDFYDWQDEVLSVYQRTADAVRSWVETHAYWGRLQPFYGWEVEGIVKKFLGLEDLRDATDVLDLARKDEYEFCWVSANENRSRLYWLDGYTQHVSIAGLRTHLERLAARGHIF